MILIPMNLSSGHAFHRFWKTFLYLCQVIPLLLSAASPSTEFQSRTWQSDEGLPHNNVRAIAQTSDGYLWIGTANGLARFDGFQFASFKHIAATNLNNPAITALLTTKDGALWIGTANGLHRWKGERLTSYFTTNGLPGDSIRALYEDKKGGLWIGTVRGFSHFENNRFANVELKRGEAPDAARSFCEDDKGNLWIAARQLHILPNGRIDALVTSNNIPAGFLSSLSRSKNGDIWIGSGFGLMRFHNDFFSLFGKEDGLDDNRITAFHEDSLGNLWVGSVGGLWRWHDGRFYGQLNSEGEVFDEVNVIFEDAEKNLWIGAKDGLSRMRPQAFSSYTRLEGLSGNNVMSVFEDEEGSVWSVAWGDGLNEIRDGKITVHHPVPSSVEGQSESRFLSLTRSRDGVLWIGADFDGGLIRIEGQAMGFHGKAGNLWDNVIRVMCEDREGNLWLGTRSALVKFVDANGTRFTTADGLAGNLIQAICEDRKGNLWIGTDKGLSRYDKKRFTTYRDSNGLSENNITALYEDADEVLWIGTRNGGLIRRKEEKFATCSEKDGIFDNNILEIVEDDFGFLWMSSLKGVFRVSKRDINHVLDGKTNRIVCLSFGKADGMASTQCNGVAKPAAWKGKDGRLWFATTKGLAVTDPKLQLIRNEKPPPVVIQRASVDKVIQSLKFKVQGANERTSTLNIEPETLNLSPGHGELEFHFIALSYAAPEKNRFKYKLEGLDSDWIEAGTRREAFYNKVPPGNYTFRVIGCNNDGVWNSVGSSIKLTLPPHFWQTGWFAGVGILFFIGFVGGTVRYATWKRIQRRLERLEQQHAVEKERTRIAQDMHDELGARITEIILLNDHGQKTETTESRNASHGAVSEAARDLATTLKAIVWAVDPGSDSLERVAPYIYDYVVKYLSHSSIRCRLDVVDDLPNRVVPSEARHNLFLVVKEAVNNIVKHANASEVWFRLRYQDSILAISIEDNGKGFTIENNSGVGNGLTNMKKRMERIGGTIQMSSEPGKGTKVDLQLRLENRRPLVGQTSCLPPRASSPSLFIFSSKIPLRYFRRSDVKTRHPI